MAAVGSEISAETRLLLIELAEGFAEAVRKNNIRLSESTASALVEWGEHVMHPERKRIDDVMPWKNITEACAYIGISQPTFRKYIRQGCIPQGVKKGGYREPMWDKEDIEKFKHWYDNR